MGSSVKKLVTIVGTNASGKSSLGVELARYFDGEIISADSRQVYRGLDIGTGKLTDEEMSGVPHHLIDIADVGDRYSVADFQTQAYKICDSLIEAGRLPFIVGGTGLYVRSVVEGYQLLAIPPNWGRRDELESLAGDELWSYLRHLDKEAADRIAKNNKRRLVRAIEILERGGTLSDTFNNVPRYTVLQLGVTWPLDVLRSRIDKRLRDRLDVGMVDEVRVLLSKGISYEELDSLGLEYRYIARLVRGEYEDEDELFENLRRAIYQFSRQQLMWFRRDTNTHWLDTSEDYIAEARQLIENFQS